MFAGQRIIDLLISAERATPFGAEGITDLRRNLESKHFRSLPDRKYFDTHIAPAIIERKPKELLYVGVRHYTRSTVDYLVQNCNRVWTTDIEDEVAHHGNGEMHRTLDITQISQGSFPVSSFDIIVLNGIIGHGVNDPELVCDLAKALAKVMPKNGLLISGWNTNKSVDPMTLKDFSKHFQPTTIGAVPERISIDGMTHVYDILKRV